jgi:hypothetical protein
MYNWIIIIYITYYIDPKLQTKSKIPSKFDLYKLIYDCINFFIFLSFKLFYIYWNLILNLKSEL